MREIKHLGMTVEGPAGKGPEKQRLLLVRNTISGRTWILNPESGIGEPIPEKPLPIATSPAPRLESVPKPGGPQRCDWCGEKKLFVIRFSATEYVTKCLACRRFVVDGREERPARAPKVSRGRDPRQQSLSFVKPPVKATGS